ncbi:hypothetical protein [Thiohalomonas denitrificans]|uniref:hypothetical protein n=1 Tax=Thiohalomonas denitrificans TaxID=415747 RepID=UPI0026F1D6DF|nr:hypothetical protein [Thiohalomonas denitrificans]
MEFIARASTLMRDADLQRYVRINNLPDWCASIDKVIASQGEKGEIYSLWGQFRIHREMIRDGVRFTLPSCPNALQWTVTADLNGSKEVVIHCTINREEHDPDFIESIEHFVADWKAGIEAGKGRPQATRTPGRCEPWYG